LTRGAFDFETWEWENPFFCGFAWGDSKDPETHYIHDSKHKHPDRLAEQTLEFMYAHDVSDWHAHNLGKFDGLFISAAAVRLGWFQKGIIAGGSRVIGLELRKPGHTKKLRLHDSYAVVSTSLRTWAEDFELPDRKLFQEDDYTIDPRKWPVKKLIEGCLTDCRLILQGLDKVETMFNEWGGQLKRTFSSSALSVIKSDLEANGYTLPDFRKNEQINEISRKAYYGARVEVFHHRPQDWLTEYDVCSAYPYAMSQRLPWAYTGHTNGKAAQRAYQTGEPCVLRASVTVPKTHSIPCLPFRPDSGGVFFPTGTWEAWFPACELEYAESLGCEVKVKEALTFTEECPFGDFINRVYSVKQTAKGALRTFTKFILNGAYGKFGERPEHSNLIVFPTEHEGLEYVQRHPNKTACLFGADNYQALAVEFERWSPHTHFALASYITARPRIALHRYLSESEEPAYCDTDAVHCRKWSGVTGTALGQLKIEIKKYKGEFYAPKIYRLTEEDGTVHLACKGFPLGKDKKEQLATFEAMVRSGKVKVSSAKEVKVRVNPKKDHETLTGVHVERMQLLKTQLRRGGTKVARLRQIKTWAGHSVKRRPLPNGETVPWTVDEIRQGIHKTANCPILEE